MGFHPLGRVPQPWRKIVDWTVTLAVAVGFVLRAIAGGIAVGVAISPWFLIVAGSGSLFMVTGKRSAELRRVGAGTVSHRRSLDGYTESFLSYVRAVASSVAILAYCLWAFEKSAAVGEQVWFELSIVPFALGLLRLRQRMSAFEALNVRLGPAAETVNESAARSRHTPAVET